LRLLRLTFAAVVALTILAASAVSRPASAQAPAATPTPGTLVRISPTSQSAVAPGEMVVDVVVDGVVDLAAYEFELSFAPDVLTFVAAGSGTFLGSTGRTVTCFHPLVDSTSGTVRFACVTTGPTPPGPSGSGVLATVRLGTSCTGSSPLLLKTALLSQPLGTGMPTQLQGGSADVTGPPCRTPTPTGTLPTAAVTPTGTLAGPSATPTMTPTSPVPTVTPTGTPTLPSAAVTPTGTLAGPTATPTVTPTPPVPTVTPTFTRTFTPTPTNTSVSPDVGPPTPTSALPIAGGGPTPTPTRTPTRTPTSPPAGANPTSTPPAGPAGPNPTATAPAPGGPVSAVPTSTRSRGVAESGRTAVAGLPATGSGFSLSPSSGPTFLRSLLVIVLAAGALLVLMQSLARLGSDAGRADLLPAGQLLVVRVAPLHNFAAFVDALGALRRAAGIERALALRQQQGEGVFRITLSAPATLEQVTRAVRRAVQGGVRIQPDR